MKRHSLALLIHPYKNVLIDPDRIRKLLDTVVTGLLEILSAHTSLRINICLPGYLLHLMDPFALSQLNDIKKAQCLEWVTSGYTEPFLCFSPQWLSEDNIAYGLQTFQELVGSRPSGFVPAFSNWEPSLIKTLRDLGISYTVLSRTLLEKKAQKYSGYWITEHSGMTMVIIPTYNLQFNNAPADILNWLEHSVTIKNKGPQIPVIAIRYLIPLVTQKKIDPLKWIHSFAQDLDKILLHYQLNLLHETPLLTAPQGLQEIPASLEFKENEDENISLIPNYLHSFDAVGIMQRKMIHIAEKLRDSGMDNKNLSLKKQLFFIQDINRYLPNINSGFPFLEDRFRTFGHLIALEQKLLKHENVTGGQISITDFLKNGIKCIKMMNKGFNVFIDYNNGGQIFELDFIDRSANIFSSYTFDRHFPPRILVSGKSKTSFIDHILDADVQRSDFLNSTTKKKGDFVTGQFDYKVKKTSSSVKAVLTRYGSISLHDKIFPLNLEKVFGLEKDKTELFFVYQLANHSLATYTFKLAIELTISLPGVLTNQATITCNSEIFDKLIWDVFTLENVTKWCLSDKRIGIDIHFSMQKPVTVWCYPCVQSTQYQGTTLVLTAPVSLEENSMWSLMGKMQCKKSQVKGTLLNVI